MSTEVGNGQINYDCLLEQSESSSEPEDFDLAFQLFDGEEMSAGMANFIGIHRMQSLNSPQSQQEPSPKGKGGGGHIRDRLGFEMPFYVDSDELKQIFGSGSDDDDGQQLEQYSCPETGAHFHKADLFQRILKLKKRRALIDRAIAEEDKMQKLAEKQQKSSLLQQQIGQAQPPQQSKGGRNKASQLGHGRQIMTDGNDKMNARQNKLDMSGGSGDNEDLKSPMGGSDDLEDAQAVVVNAGRAKYASNDPHLQPQQHYINSSAGAMTSHSNAVSANSYMHQPPGQQQQSKTTHHPKNKNCVRSQERSSAVQKHSLLPANQPPHERLLQFAANQAEVEQRQA